MKNIAFLCLSIVLLSCGPTVFVDYDQETDFTKHQTFQFKEANTNRFNESASHIVHAFDAKRIKNAIDSVLTEQEWQRTDYCQFYIDFYKEEILEDYSPNVTVGASSGDGFSAGIGVVIPLGKAKVQERLVIEVYEAYNNGTLVWQGSVLAKIKEGASPLQKEVHYQKMVSKILADFPPQKNTLSQ